MKPTKRAKTPPRTRIRGLSGERPALYMVCDMRRSVAPASCASMLQYRDKHARGALRLERARALVKAARKTGALAIVNDSPELAVAVDADGVHLGLSDADITTARTVVGEERIIGASCQNSIAAAQSAIAQGADYVAFGSVFASRTKPQAPRMPLSRLKRCAAQLATPVCAIGGIHAGNIRLVAKTGVALIAVSAAARDSRRLCNLLNLD